MNRWRFTVIGLTLLVQACVSTSEFSKKGNFDVKRVDEFGVLEATPATYKGVAVRMAGRIVDVIEQPNRETLIVADWLPTPEDSYVEPREKVPGGEEQRFLVFFPGKIDRAYQWKGNTFLAAAKMEGMKEFQGRQVPYLLGSCLRIWTTGLANTSPMPWEEGGAQIDELQKTYCFR